MVRPPEEHERKAPVPDHPAKLGIAFFEYVLQVPANRLGIHYFNLGQLKVIQEIITMIVFAGFAFFYMRQPLKLDYLWAGFCLVGAAYFMFRGDLLHV